MRYGMRDCVMAPPKGCARSGTLAKTSRASIQALRGSIESLAATIGRTDAEPGTSPKKRSQAPKRSLSVTTRDAAHCEDGHQRNQCARPGEQRHHDTHRTGAGADHPAERPVLAVAEHNQRAQQHDGREITFRVIDEVPLSGEQRH